MCAPRESSGSWSATAIRASPSGGTWSVSPTARRSPSRGWTRRHTGRVTTPGCPLWTVPFWRLHWMSAELSGPTITRSRTPPGCSGSHTRLWAWPASRRRSGGTTSASDAANGTRRSIPTARSAAHSSGPAGGSDHGKMRLHLIRFPILRPPSMDMHMAVLLSDLNANVSASFLLNAAVFRGFSMTERHWVS